MLYIWFLSLIGSVVAATAYYNTTPDTFIIGSGLLWLIAGALGVTVKDRGLQQLLQWLHRFCFAVIPFGIAEILWQSGEYPVWVGDGLIIMAFALNLFAVTLMFRRWGCDMAFSVIASFMSLPLIGPVVGPGIRMLWLLHTMQKPNKPEDRI